MEARMIVFIIFCIAEGLGLVADGYFMLCDNKYETLAEVGCAIIKKMTDRAIFSCIVYLFFM